jgi:hypothetical protein
MHAAGRYADVPSLEAAYELGMQYTVETLEGAAMCNQLPVLRFLRTQDCPQGHSVADAAAAAGAYDVLRWLRGQGCTWNESSILGRAASSGNIEMTAWVKQKAGVVCDEGAMNGAAREGHTAMCKYLRDEHCPWGTDACHHAARRPCCHTALVAREWLSLRRRMDSQSSCRGRQCGCDDLSTAARLDELS